MRYWCEEVYWGCQSQVVGEQTLLNTFLPEHMNPLPRDAKVNGPEGTAAATKPTDTAHI